MSDHTGSRPNILLLFPDQWRGDALSCLGDTPDTPDTPARTPFLDELASQGTTFTAAYSNCPVCIPARASLIMGQSSSTVGRLGYRDGITWNYAPTFMHLLRDGGYQTLLSGKTHFHPPRAHLGFEQMALYDNQRHWPDFRSDYDRWLEQRTQGQIQDTAQQLSSNSMLVQPWTHDESLHANSWTVTAATEMLERRDPMRPFFLQMNFHRPHPPIDPPIEYFERFAGMDQPEPVVGDWVDWDEREWRIDHTQGTVPPWMLHRARQGYYAQLAHLDFQIGRLLRWLQLRGMLNNTIILFSSDHGEMLGDHRLFRKSVPFEGSMRIPMIVRLPWSHDVPRGRRCDKPVALYDIMPTVLEAAGVAIPETVEAASLLPLARGQETPWRSHVHGEQTQHSSIGSWQCVTDGRHKYIWQPESGKEWFFDLRHDPQECRNLAGDASMTDELDIWRGRLVEVLRQRPEDQLTDGDRLKPGTAPPFVRPWVLKG